MVQEKKEITKEVADKALEAIRLARQTGSIRKGVNETTKSIERGLSTLVVIAGDVEPQEVVMHLPMLCEQRKIPYLHVPSKLELGKSVGLNVPCASVAIEKQGEGAKLVADVVSRTTGRASAPVAKPAQEHKKEEHKKEEHKKQ
jgi:large subunit ribosomal protein L7Ae